MVQDGRKMLRGSWVVPSLLLLLLAQCRVSCCFLLASFKTTKRYAVQNDNGSIMKLKANNKKGFSTTREILTRQIIRGILDQLKESDLIQEKHQEHVESDSVTHLFKNTPLAQLPDEYKLQFVNSWAGGALERVMKEEQDYLGQWKIDKIVQAARGSAADANENADELAIAAQDKIKEHLTGSTIVMYSFVDCPWCVAARTLLEEQYPTVSLLVVELESLQQLGKVIRAELALWTGRTSMPCIILNGRPIGGYTDGAPYCGPGLQALHESNRLEKMLLEIEEP